MDTVIIQQTQEQCPVLTTQRKNEDGFQSDTASNEVPVDRDMPVMDLAEGESDITATHFDVRDPGKWPAVISDEKHKTVQEVPQHGANQLREATSQESCVFITQCDDPTTMMSLSLLIDDSKDL